MSKSRKITASIFLTLGWILAIGITVLTFIKNEAFGNFCLNIYSDITGEYGKSLDDFYNNFKWFVYIFDGLMALLTIIFIVSLTKKEHECKTENSTNNKGDSKMEKKEKLTRKAKRILKQAKKDLAETKEVATETVEVVKETRKEINDFLANLRNKK